MSAAATSIELSASVPQRYAVPDFARTFAAMACQVNVRISNGGNTAEASLAFADIAAVFGQVEQECTRFVPGSALMRANAIGNGWYCVGRFCFEAIREAASAHESTAGLFDPRVLDTLIALGYDQTLPFDAAPVSFPALGHTLPSGARVRWTPGLDATIRAVRIGPAPIDLGGIGKGLAVRWAAEHIRERCSSFFINAGGDGYFCGDGPAGAGWQVGIEDPSGATPPVAVLSLSNLACATSSTRIRRWSVGDHPVHHLIDPRTGEPAAGGLSSVTVVAADPAAAEVWSKVLFLHGASGIASATQDQQLAAVWVDDQGCLGLSAAAEPLVIWRSR